MDDFGLKTDAKLFAPRKTILHSTVEENSFSAYLSFSFLLQISEFHLSFSPKFGRKVRRKQFYLIKISGFFFVFCFFIFQFAASAGAGACRF